MRERIGSYRIVELLGRGGMGVVYKGYDESLDRHVAIKVLSDELTNDATFLERFQREAKSAAGPDELSKTLLMSRLPKLRLPDTIMRTATVTWRVTPPYFPGYLPT